MTVTLAVGWRYAFRYLDLNGNWFNDDAADDFVPSGFGGHKGVIDLTTGPQPDAERARRRLRRFQHPLFVT